MEGTDAFRAWIVRRCRGEPLPYIVGWTEFRHLRVATDRRALIPRPETEGLVDLVLGLPEAGGTLADVGTGTGCVALAFAQEAPRRFPMILGIDASREALALARENAMATGLAVRYFAGDLTTGIRSASLGVLVSNPPYLTAAEYEDLDPAVRAWEPIEALVGGADGLLPYRRLLNDGRRVLVPGGVLAMEVDTRRAPMIAELARRHGWSEVTLAQDLFGRDRYLLARWRTLPC